jgi:hypothetical protein
METEYQIGLRKARENKRQQRLEAEGDWEK